MFSNAAGQLLQCKRGRQQSHAPLQLVHAQPAPPGGVLVVAPDRRHAALQRSLAGLDQGDRQPGQERGGARHVAVGGDAAGDDILNLGRLDAGTLHRVADRMAQHGHVGRVVEAAACRLGQPGAGVGNDDRLSHG
jgi:hypothetical protein